MMAIIKKILLFSSNYFQLRSHDDFDKLDKRLVFMIMDSIHEQSSNVIKYTFIHPSKGELTKSNSSLVE
jgi:hypothetical protein